MKFKKIKLYKKKKKTGELKVTFLCDKCRKEMEKPDYWYFKSTINEKDNGYHFYCEKCKNKM